jgi:hypothetical protein
MVFCPRTATGATPNNLKVSAASRTNTAALQAARDGKLISIAFAAGMSAHGSADAFGVGPNHGTAESTGKVTEANNIQNQQTS